MRTVAKATSKRLNLHIFEVSCYELIGESVAATEARLKNVFQKGLLTATLCLLDYHFTFFLHKNILYTGSKKVL